MQSDQEETTGTLPEGEDSLKLQVTTNKNGMTSGKKENIIVHKLSPMRMCRMFSKQLEALFLNRLSGNDM